MDVDVCACVYRFAHAYTHRKSNSIGTRCGWKSRNNVTPTPIQVLCYGLQLGHNDNSSPLCRDHECNAMKCLSLHLVLLIALLSAAVCQRFDFPSFSSRSRGLQVDGDGKIYTAAGSQLYRLNRNLVQEESW